MTTAKNSSFLSNLVNNAKCQTGSAAASACEESLSTASQLKDSLNTSSAQELYQCQRDVGHKEYLFKLAYVFHTNNY